MQIIIQHNEINNIDLEEIKLNYHQFEEQEKIASFLSKVDEKIEKLEKKHEIWKTYKKGIMQQLFSQKLRFKDENGEDYPDWEEKKLDDIGIFFSGGTPYTSNIEYYNGNIPFIKSGEIDKSITEQFISKNGLENSSAKLVNKGDLLFALYGANSGQVAISKIDGAINNSINIKTNEDNIFLFIYYFTIEQKRANYKNLSSRSVK